jgi:iron complex transport system permease protein
VSGEVLVTACGGRLAVLVHRRSAVVTLTLLVAVAALATLSTAVGTRLLPVSDVLAGLTGTAERAVNLTVREFRLPRTAVALLVGMALGLSGALTQALTRNPLASPDVLGVVNGASAGAVAVLITAGGATAASGGATATLSRIGVPLGAIAGALLSTALVLGIASRRIGGLHGTQRVVLVGILLNAVFLGLVQWALTIGDVDQATKAAVWLTGSLHGRGWEHVSAVGLALVVLLPLALLLRRPLEAVALGEDVTASLGVAIKQLRLSLFTLAFALAGTAVAAAGAISFVALLAPPLARRATGRAAPLLTSALTGAVLLLAADLIARRALPGHELPAGAVTALVGAPVLLLLLLRRT